MENNRLDAAIIDIATMKADIRSMSESFKEFKNETKDFHERQSKQLDDMARQWNEVGGVVKMVADINNRMNVIETNKKDEHKEMWQEIQNLKTWRTWLAGAGAIILGLIAIGIIKLNTLF